MKTIKSWIGSFVLWVIRWKAASPRPPLDKYVLVCVPHTSNWDFVFFLALGWKLKIKASWVGKKSLFKFPFGWFMRAVGGIAIDRSNPTGLVDTLAERFATVDTLCLAVPPSGTRSKGEYWKSGFLRIAKAADVPVVFGFLDFTKKEGGFMEPLTITGDTKTDMDAIRAIYKDVHKMAKFPENVSNIRLRSEDSEEDKDNQSIENKPKNSVKP